MNHHRVINAAQELLKSINTSIGGLQNALLAQNLQFTIERDRFVQILHVSGNHWITIANNGCTGGETKVYDSMGHSDLPEETKQQVAALIFNSVNKITLTFQTVQRQQDSSSCGLFAVAFATSLCFGSDPSTIMYDSATLRSHLKHCFVYQESWSLSQARKQRLEGQLQADKRKGKDGQMRQLSGMVLQIMRKNSWLCVL